MLRRALVDTPFPFAWAQAASGLLLLCALGLPLHMAASAAGAAGAVVSAALVVLVCVVAVHLTCIVLCCAVDSRPCADPEICPSRDMRVYPRGHEARQGGDPAHRDRLLPAGAGLLGRM